MVIANRGAAVAPFGISWCVGPFCSYLLQLDRTINFFPPLSVCGSSGAVEGRVQDPGFQKIQLSHPVSCPKCAVSLAIGTYLSLGESVSGSGNSVITVGWGHLDYPDH